MSSAKKKKDSTGKKPAVPEKPVMRGLHRAMMLKNIYIASALSLSTAVVMYFVYNRRRIHKFRKFYEEYDAEAMFDRICAKNRFDCCPPPPPEPEPEPEPEDKKGKKK